MATTRPRKPAVSKVAPALPAGDEAIDKLVHAACMRNDAAAKIALRKLQGEVVVPLVERRLKDPKAKVRASAYSLINCVATWIHHVPIGTLLPGLSDEDAQVRLNVMFALKRNAPGIPYFYAKDRAVLAPRLAPLLGDPDKRVKEQAGHVWKLLALGE